MRDLDEISISKNWQSFLRYLDRRTTGIQTGIGCLDQYLLGLGGLTTLQGDTAANKSTLLLQIATHQLKKGHAALMLDFENGDGRIKSRLVCQVNGISEIDLMTASLEQKRIWAKPVQKLSFYVNTEAIKSTEDVAQRVKEMGDRHPGPILLLVDSLQALTPIDDDQRVNLEKWMVFFDSLKVQYDGRLTILLTSETKRAGYGTEEGVGRGKGTGNIEYKSESLLDMRVNSETGHIELRVSKHRDGLKGAKFLLEKVLADSSNKRSFTFQLKEAKPLLDI